MTSPTQFDDFRDAGGALSTLTASERAILDLVRREPDLSRAEIADRLLLSPAMLTKTITRFTDLGLTTEQREARPRLGRGQPALRLRVRPDAVFGLGVGLTTAGISLAAVDLTGGVLEVRRHRCPATAMEDTRAVLDRELRSMIAAHGGEERLAGIGLWIPALLDRAGQVLEVTPSQRGIDYHGYRAFLEARFGAEVWFENQPHACYEAMRPSDLGPVVFLLLLDFGVGGSLIEDMRVFRGGHGHAVNIGALLPDSGPRASMTDLAAHLGTQPDALGERRLAAMMAERDPRLMAWIDDRGQGLSEPLSIVVQLFNPTAIVVGGMFPRALYEALLERVDLGHYDHPGRAPLPKPALHVASVVGPDAMAVASAAVPIARRLGG